MCAATYDYGTHVSLTATPSGTDAFTGWSGGGCSGTGACVIDVTQATTVFATFRPTNVLTVTLDASANGSGSVTSAPAGIDCGATCDHRFPDTTTVTLTASPATGSEVTWGGDCASAGHALSCDVQMSVARDVTIAFTLLRLTLSVDITGIGSVDVSADGATTTCDTDCAPVFDFGTPIHLDALPGTGQYLVAWGGDCTADGQGGCDLTIEAEIGRAHV